MSVFAFGQFQVKGTITDERGVPIPSAKIYVKNAADLRTVADIDGNYEMLLYPDEYFLVVSAAGYEDREAYLTVSDGPVVKDISLFPIQIQDIENVSVSAKKSNPGREIMLEVVKRRDSFNLWNYPHSVEAYIKATEKIDRDEEKDDRKKRRDEEENTDPNGIEDPFAEQRKANEEFASNMNLIEVDLIRHYGGPGKVKEIRNGFEQRGEKRNHLYYTTTVKSNFNFFENLLHLNDLHQTPVSSPISGPGILSYKYRLEDQYEENGMLIDKIKIIARNTATTTLSGYVYVIDSLWLIQKIDLSMEKGNLLIYDYFQIYQEYDHPGDSLCVLTHQKLTYGVKYKESEHTCSTITNFNNYNFNPVFPKRFFNNELSSTEVEAYDKDSLYWKEKRNVELTPEEIKFIIIKDSIADYHNRKEYQDSVDAIFNKVTALKILWWGVDHRNREKQMQWTINSLAGLIRPVYIAGPRVSPGFFFFKKWEDERAIDSYTETSYGFLNSDIKGRTNWDFRYAPFHFGTISAGFSHDFDVIRGYDAITQIYKRDNFIEKTEIDVGHDYELFNGFFLETTLSFAERRSLKDYRFLGDVLEGADSILPNNDPTEFESYQALIFDGLIKYTPGQKYMREAYRKVILGSKWPTFYFGYEKGIEGPFGSDVNHDYIRAGIMQTFKIGTIGTSNYHIKIGQFINTKKVYDADRKFQRRSDPIWFSNPLYSFQGLDSTLATNGAVFEAHFVHHDNGAIINKIPFMKKARIGLVFGAGYLNVPEHNWQHWEVVGGIERNFKLSRRRLRIGFYGVLSDGNHINPTPDWKISLAILNNRSMKWNF